MPSPRRETITRIEELVNTRQQSISNPKLSSPTIQKIHEKLVDNEKVQPFKGRAGHIRNILDAASIETNKNFYRDGARIPLKELKELETILKEKGNI